VRPSFRREAKTLRHFIVAGHNCLPLSAVDLYGGATKGYAPLKLDQLSARTLIMELAKWYDPSVLRITPKLDMRADLYNSAAVFRLAFKW
jgi:hypothetical protein